jgi:hypothetical protein
MYELLVKFILVAALLQLGMSLPHFENFHSVECVQQSQFCSVTLPILNIKQRNDFELSSTKQP